MAIINEEKIRQWLTREQVTPGSEIARYIAKTVGAVNWPGQTIIQQTEQLTYDSWKRSINLTLESYQAAMAILIANDAVNETLFSADTLYAFKKARLENFAQKHKLPLQAYSTAPNPFQKVHPQIQYYESVFGMIADRLGLPANPPTYSELVSWCSGHSVKAAS